MNREQEVALRDLIDRLRHSFTDVSYANLSDILREGFLAGLKCAKP